VAICSFANVEVELMLDGEAIALETPGLAAVVAGQDQSVVAHCPAAQSIEEEDAREHLGSGHRGLPPVAAIVVGEQNRAVLAGRHHAVARGDDVQQCRCGGQRHDRREPLRRDLPGQCGKQGQCRQQRGNPVSP
jgi:hypothetical protein